MSNTKNSHLASEMLYVCQNQLIQNVHFSFRCVAKLLLFFFYFHSPSRLLAFSVLMYSSSSGIIWMFRLCQSTFHCFCWWWHSKAKQMGDCFFLWRWAHIVLTHFPFDTLETLLTIMRNSFFCPLRIYAVGFFRHFASFFIHTYTYIV